MTRSTFICPNFARDRIHGRIYLGGGGPNGVRAYTIVAGHLGLPDTSSTLLGFAGEEDMPLFGSLQPGIFADLVTVPGRAREVEYGDPETWGPHHLGITFQHIQDLVAKLKNIQPGSTVAITGSLPDDIPGLSYEFLIDLVQLIQQRFHARVLVDTRPRYLKPMLATAGCQPDFIKPNKSELEKLTGVEDIDPEDDHQLAQLCEMVLPTGVVIATLGDHGAFLYDHGETYRIRTSLPSHLTCVSTVGCGDCTVGGTLAGLDHNPHDVVAAVALGIVAATANTTTDEPGAFPYETFTAINRNHLVITPVAARATAAV